MAQFVAYLFNVDNVLIMITASVVIAVTRYVFPWLEDHRAWVRSLPLQPIALCSIFVWLPGLAPGCASEKILLGIVLGTFSGQAHKVVKQSIFGNDKRIRDHPTRL